MIRTPEELAGQLVHLLRADPSAGEQIVGAVNVHVWPPFAAAPGYREVSFGVVTAERKRYRVTVEQIP